MIGYYCFTQPPVVAVPPMKEKVADLSPEIKTTIHTQFINHKSPEHVSIETGMEFALVKYLYDTYEAIRERSKQYMRGEVIIIPAVTHEENGEVIVDTPAVYNIPPATSAELRDTVRLEFVDDIPVAVFATIITEMINWSKYDGSGSFVFYKSQIIL